MKKKNIKIICLALCLLLIISTLFVFGACSPEESPIDENIEEPIVQTPSFDAVEDGAIYPVPSKQKIFNFLTIVEKDVRVFELQTQLEISSMISPLESGENKFVLLYEDTAKTITVHRKRLTTIQYEDSVIEYLTGMPTVCDEGDTLDFSYTTWKDERINDFVTFKYVYNDEICDLTQPLTVGSFNEYDETIEIGIKLDNTAGVEIVLAENEWFYMDQISGKAKEEYMTSYMLPIVYQDDDNKICINDYTENGTGDEMLINCHTEINVASWLICVETNTREFKLHQGYTYIGSDIISLLTKHLCSDYNVY